jgi:hypothetical protein
MRSNHKAGTMASSARAARRTAAQVTPLARKSGAAAGRGVHRARAWAAPQVERTGQVLQHSVAPRVSALLSSAARRLEPAKPRRGWRKLVGIPVITAAAGAAAALVRNRRKQDLSTSAADPDAAAKADGVTPAPQPGDGQAKASADSNAKGPVRTS